MQSLVNYSFWPSVLDISHVPQIHSTPSSTLFSSLKANLCGLSQGAPLWWVTGFIKSGTRRRLRGERRAGSGYSVPGTPPCWLWAAWLSLRGRRAVWPPLRTAVFPGSDSPSLPAASHCQALHYRCGFPAPCFITNTFIKLNSDDPVCKCRVSCWALINDLSSLIINFLGHS